MNYNNWSYQREDTTENLLYESDPATEGVIPAGNEKKPFEMEGYTTLFDKAVVLTPVELTTK